MHSVSLAFRDLLNRLRQPEYIGENRCALCTVVNIAIATGLSALAAVVSLILGVGMFALSLGTIYFRGYLVPGTPTFTKRHFPERVLQWFNNDDTIPVTNKITEIDPEQVLFDADAVEPCQDGTDLCLTPEFQQAWRERIHFVRALNLDENHLVDALDDSNKHDHLTVDQKDDAFLAYSENAVIGQWSSQAAVIADVAAATELSECSPNWEEFSPTETARILMSLRIFIEQCPICDGPVRINMDVVESCCRSYDVVASACQDCDAHLFEMEWDDVSAEEPRTQSDQSTQTSV